MKFQVLIGDSEFSQSSSIPSSVLSTQPPAVNSQPADSNSNSDNPTVYGTVLTEAVFIAVITTAMTAVLAIGGCIVACICPRKSDDVTFGVGAVSNP